jgi:hypothetical protein
LPGGFFFADAHPQDHLGSASDDVLAGDHGIVAQLSGAWLARRNEKQAATERLLVAAVNDLVDSIAGVAQGEAGAHARYASALARISLHGPPNVVRAFRDHQEDATTVTPEGRRLLPVAVQVARKELGHQSLDERDIEVLLFGPPPSAR